MAQKTTRELIEESQERTARLRRATVVMREYAATVRGLAEEAEGLSS